MARLISLWELIMQGSRRELSQLVEWTPQGTPQQVRLYLVDIDGKLRPDLAQFMRQRPDEFRYHFRQDKDLATRMRHSEVRVLAHEESGSDAELLERWKHGDPVEPVRYFCASRSEHRPKGSRQSRRAPFP